MPTLAPEKRKRGSLLKAATTIVRPFIGDTRHPAKPLVAGDPEWLVFHDPSHEPIRMDVHCPSCGVWNCGCCSWCEDDYFQCCWTTCSTGCCRCP